MRLLAIIGLLGIIGGIGAAVFFFGGFYGISAVPQDPAIVTWALTHVRNASIDRHAVETPSVSLTDPAVIAAGAKAFAQRGCVSCHGGPGADWAKFSEGLRPDPPDLKELADELQPRHIFWVVKNGINMTGMPSFGRIGVEDKEIWSIAAFVKQLPKVTDEQFKAWSSAP
jgi:mono/diheme cytochrome c family protein